MAEEKTYVFGDGNNGYNNGWGGVPFSIPITGFGNGFGYGYGNGYGYGGGLLGGGFGAGILGGILGGLIPGFFGGNGFGWGNNGNGAAAASLGAQATANANTDLIIQAINGTDSDVRLLASTLNSDIDSVRLAINTVQGAIQTVGAQLGLTGQQIINSLQMGDANISRQICECCCQTQQSILTQGYEGRIQNMQQTETLGAAINGQGQRTVDAIADLKTTMVREFCDVKEREMQDKINTLTANNTLLRSQIDNAAQTAQIGAMIAPLAREVDDIKCAMPQTVPVQWPQLTAVNTTPYVSGGFYGQAPGFGWGGFGGFGNGFGGNIVF